MIKVRGTFVLIVLLSLISKPLISQSKSIAINISCSYGDQRINLKNSVFTSQDSVDIKISTLRFYISDIQFLKGEELMLSEKNSYYLIDASEQESFQFSILNKEKISFDHLRFNLGIDSTTNVSGVLGGDLDPIKGMYWTWQSGYINFKLEGNSGECNTRNNEFIFHLGGYLPPNDCLEVLTFPVVNTDEINIDLDIKSVLDQIELSKINHIMSPSKTAVEMSELVANAFSIR